MTPAAARILLVDDRAENLDVLEALLGDVPGVELHRAHSGTEALELLLEKEFALALVDVEMPGMDGYELATLMRGPERTKYIPIVFVTAHSPDDTRVFAGYEVGAVDFLFKPLDPAVLRGKVRTFVELFRQRLQLAKEVHQRDLLVAALRDREEALREADRRKDQFLSVLSHELRNPLAPIRNALLIMSRAEPGTERARSAQAVIERQTEHLTRLVDDLLDVTRISRGKVQLQRTTMDAAEVVARTLDDHRPVFADAGVDLAADVRDAPLWIDGDPTRVAQVLGNLLHNAVKFTPRGGRVAVRAERLDSAAVIHVLDTGVGIAPELVGRVFEPFVQADETLHRSRGGLGLGLALVNGLVALHGGKVSVASPGAGQGAEFTLRFPIVPPPTAAERRHGGGRHAQGSRRVLVVEDNVDAAETIRDMLEMSGHEVRVVHDGGAGVAAARAWAPDVVLCDIGLPVMNGYEVARAIRADPAIADTYLVAITGYTQPEDKRKAAEAGFDKHLAKPCSPEVIEKAVEGGRGEALVGARPA